MSPDPDPDPIRPESRGPQGALGGLIKITIFFCQLEIQNFWQLRLMLDSKSTLLVIKDKGKSRDVQMDQYFILQFNAVFQFQSFHV